MIKFIQSSILIVLVFSPLAFGSVEPWAYSLINLVGFLLLAVWAFHRLFVRSSEGLEGPGAENDQWGGQREASHRIHWRDSAAGQKGLVLYLLAAFTGLVIFQLIPLPVFVVRLLSPARIRFIENLHSDTSRAVTLSTNPYLTSIALLNLIGLLIYFLLIRRMLVSPAERAYELNRPDGETDQTAGLDDRADLFRSGASQASPNSRRVGVRNSFLKRLTFTLIAMGFLVALFGIVQKLSGTQEIYGLRKLTHGGSLMGPFVNRDHFAGYIEMTFGLTLGLLLFLNRKVGYRWLLGLAAVLMGAAMLYSGSRGGLLCFFFELLCAGVLVLTFRTTLSFKFNTPGRPFTSVSVIPVLLIAVIATISWIGPEAVLGRLNEDVTHDVRLTVWHDTWSIVKSFPVLGSGLGTFRSVFPHFQSKDFPVQFLQAHNDYLQLLAETGVLGTALILFALATIGRRPFRERRSTSDQVMWPEQRERRGSAVGGLHFNRAVRLGAFIGLCGILLHSCFDFNLQIPSNALLFTTLCALVSR